MLYRDTALIDAIHKSLLASAKVPSRLLSGQVESSKPREVEMDTVTGIGNGKRLCPVLGHLFSTILKWMVMILGLFKEHTKQTRYTNLEFTWSCLCAVTAKVRSVPKYVFWDTQLAYISEH